MKKMTFKRVFAIASALVIGGIALLGIPSNVKAALTEEEIARNTWYRLLVDEQSVFKGQRSDFLFDLADVDDDGSIDLVMSYYDSAFGAECRVAWSYDNYINQDGDVNFEIDLMGRYEATEENKNLYLPVEDSLNTPTGNIPTGEYTLAPVTLRVGDVFPLTNTNLDYLISQDVVDLNGPISDSYHGSNVTIDSDCVSRTVYYAFYDAATLSEVIHAGYWTEEEANAFYATGNNGSWTYNGIEVIPVEEGESLAFYNIRADRAGAATVTISNYKIGDTTIVLNIPLTIEAAPSAPTTPSQPTIPPQQGSSVGSQSPSTGTTTPVVTPSGSTSVATRPQSAATVVGSANVSVADASNVLPAGATMNTYPITSGATYEAAASIARANIPGLSDFAVYEFDLYDSSRASIHQLNGYISVTVPVPEGLEIPAGKTVVVYRVEDNGALTRCATTVADGKITFQTNHFSTYIFAVTDAARSPKTADNNMAGVFAMAMFAAAGMLVCVSRRKAIRLNDPPKMVHRSTVRNAL